MTQKDMAESDGHILQKMAHLGGKEALKHRLVRIELEVM